MPSQMLPDIPYYYLPEILITVIVDPEHISSMCQIDDMVIEVMAVNPRRLLRCTPVKIEAGSQADLTLIDPARTIEVTESYFESKSKNSAFLGAKLTGVATDVLVAGKRTLANGVVA